MRAGYSSDHAKLLFLGLLRTVSALATKEGIPHTYSRGVTPPALEPLTLRIARRQDVPSIQRCNVATLPENYNSNFYANHLMAWPDLALVAVDTSASTKSSTSMFGSSFPTERPEEKIVAYVLGKIEERNVLVHDPYLNHHNLHSSIRSPYYATERLGHVTSLAVLEPYRRRGLAAELMKQLHYHLACQQVDAVGLHVRESNHAAELLYRNFGYRQEERIVGYYQDGEDAFFMKKRLEPIPMQAQGIFGTLRRGRPWDSGPRDLRLPRTVGVPDPYYREESSEESPELLTGTM